LNLPQTNSFICSESFQATERSFVPLEDILESERKAMEIVMNIEKQRLIERHGENANWKVEDVSLRERYDTRVSQPDGGVHRI
jgi:hypothetical protein